MVNLRIVFARVLPYLIATLCGFAAGLHLSSQNGFPASTNPPTVVAQPSHTR